MDDHEAFDLFHAALDIQPRPGAFERLKTVLARSSVKPSSRLEIGLPLLRQDVGFTATPSLRWMSGIMAVLLAVAVVAGLLYSRGAFHQIGAVKTAPPVQQSCPASGPPISPSPAPTAAAPSAFPSEDLQAAWLDNPDLVTPFHVRASIGNETVTLVGGYADPVVTVLILRPDPGDTRRWLVELVHDDQGDKIYAIGGGPVASGDYVFTLAGPKGYGSDRIAHLEVVLGLQSATPVQQPAGPPEYVLDNAAGSTLIDFSLAVQQETLLPVPSPFRLSGGTVSIMTLELTPARLHLHADRVGVQGDSYDPQASGREVMFKVCLPCPSTLQASPTPPVQSDCVLHWLGVDMSALTGGGYSMDIDWPRPAAGTYRLVFSTALGDTRAVTLRVPY
jgi:hypothetical protein